MKKVLVFTALLLATVTFAQTPKTEKKDSVKKVKTEVAKPAKKVEVAKPAKKAEAVKTEKKDTVKTVKKVENKTK